MKYVFILITLFTYGVTNFVSAGEKEHKHTEKKAEDDDHHENHGEHDEHEDHAENDAHGHGDSESEDKHAAHDEHEHGGHGEHEENAQVGPNKGILEANETDGIKLSPEAEKNFEISRIKASGSPIELPQKAIVSAVSEINVYRYRNGFYKRIDFDEVARKSDKVTIRSKDIRAGDEIVTQGLGFLRLAEIAAFGGAPEGHSH